MRQVRKRDYLESIADMEFQLRLIISNFTIPYVPQDVVFTV